MRVSQFSNLVPRPSSTSHELDDWVPISEAADATGQSVRHWRRIAVKGALKSLARKAPPRLGVGNRVWWIRRSGDIRLARSVDRSTRDDQDRATLLESFPIQQVEQAYRKAYWLRQWNTACQRRRSGDVTQKALAEKIVAEAREVDGADFSISYRALQHWRRAYEAHGVGGRIAGVAGLIDGRAVESSKVNDSDSNGASGTRDQEAIDYFFGLYQTEQRLSRRYCHELTAREAKRRKWAWSAAYSSTTRWLLRHDDRSTSFLLRHGSEAWCHKYMPFLEIDYTAIAPGQFFQTDHHQCDFWIEHEGTQLRPWLTVVQDLRSRAVCGWHLGVAPHQDAIAACYLSAFRDWAIPETLRIDNGKDYASRLLTGVTKATRDRLRRKHGPNWREVLRRDQNQVDIDTRFVGITEELGVKTVYAIPYSPWSKGITERWFGTFEGRCGKSFATYCGNSAVSKPQCLDAIRRGYTSEQKRSLRKRHGRDWKRLAVLRFVDTSDVPTLDQAQVAIGEFVDVYHNTSHSADDMAGRTPLEVWRTATQLRKADDTALLFLMQARGVYRVGPNGVAFKIGGERLKYGFGNPCLYPHIGRDVFITLDPNHLDCCYAFTPGREQRTFIGRLDSNKRISPNATVADLREAGKRVGRRRKIMGKAVRESPARTRTAVEEVAAHRRERAAELRATGTDDAGQTPNIVPVRTGMETAAESAKNAANKAVRPDRKSRDLAVARKALVYGYDRPPPEKPRRPRVTLSMIAGFDTNHRTPVTDDGTEAPGTDAETPQPDPLGPVAEARHERQE